MVYKYEINRNCIPQCDVFEPNGYTKEEMKLVKETKKILSDDSIKVTATAVRVPVVGGHSEAVNVEFSNDFDVNEVRTLLSQTDGVTVQDNLDTFTYPMPKYAEGKNDVFVGRIRRDESQANTLNMWIVADNLRRSRNQHDSNCRIFSGTQSRLRPFLHCIKIRLTLNNVKVNRISFV